MADQFEKYKVSNSSQDEFEQYRVKSPEIDSNILNRIPHALSEIGSDIGNITKALPGVLIEQLNKAPGYAEYLKKNIPATGSLIVNNPGSATRESIAGLAELGHTALNIPHGLFEYLAKIGMIKPETAAAIPFQKDISSELSQFVGEEKPGGELLRGIVRNIPSIIPAGKAVSVINPLKFTSKSIAKDVVKTEGQQVASHTARYNKIWDEAEKSGFNQVPIDKSKLVKNLEPIEKYKTPREYESLKTFIDNPTLKNAQKAQSDMGQIHRKLEEKSRTSSLTSEERSLYDAAKDSEKHIEENMFKNSKGEINKSLQNKYGKLTKSYRENVVPYRYNADIQAYKNQEMLAKELVARLKRGEFAAKKGSVHPRIGLRDMLGISGIAGGTFGAGYLLKKLLGENPTKPE